VLAGCGAKQVQYKTVLPTDPNFIAAQEVELKVRELADQLIASLPNDALVGFVALPTSFVDQNNFNASSPLGRYLAEGLIYEFSQRGFPVREYRTDGSITMSEGMGETALARKGKIATAKGKGNALLIGTYHQDPDVIFVNARLVRSSDGIVLRTGQVLLTPNAVTLRMTNAGPDGMPLSAWVESRKQPGEMIYPEPGSGPLFSYTPASKAGGMRIRQAAPQKTISVASRSGGLMGYAPE
jgi:TolB-like protein